MVVKARRKLDPAWSVPTAVRHLVRELLPRLRSGERGTIDGNDSKYVHRARVALRRMRSALKLIERWDETASHLRSGFGRIAQVLGSAREWDVLLEESLPQLKRAMGKSATLERITEIARIERDSARSQARRALASPYYRALTTQLERWLDRGHVDGEPSAPLKSFATNCVGKRYKRLLRDGRDLAAQTPARRHDVRLDAKRLRYTVEFFEPLYPRGRARPLLRELVLIQDALGSAEDIRNAARFFASLRPRSVVARFAREWLAVREQRNAETAQRAFVRLARGERLLSP